MSTKIYNAYSWRGGDVVLWLSKLRDLYVQDGAETLKALCATRKDKDSHDFFYDLINEMEKAADGPTYHPYDFSLSCVVYRHRLKTVVHFFGLNKGRFPRVYEEVRKLKDFSFWNNSDGPEDVPQWLFDKRGDWYDSLFKKYGSEVPDVCGLTYEFNCWRAYHEMVSIALEGKK